MSHCSHCLTPNAPWICPCHHAYYCNQKCQEADFETHQDMCVPIHNELIEAVAESYPIVVPYKHRGFYKASIKLMNQLKSNDFFSYMCLLSYMVSPFVNFILFKVKGDFTKFNHTFFDVHKTNDWVHQMVATEADPYSIFGTFFKLVLHEAKQRGLPFRDRNGFEISTKSEFQLVYPVMKKYLNMKDRRAFLKIYISAIQNAIYSIPKLRAPLTAYRGWKPLNLYNTLAMDVSQMKVGQKITNWGFTSISLDLRISEFFTDQQKQCCFAHITIPAGFPSFLISSDVGDYNYPILDVMFEQAEILLPIGCVFVVTHGVRYITIPTFENTTRTVRMINLKLIKIKKVKTK